MRMPTTFLILAALAGIMLLASCRSTEYYHRTNTAAQRDADYVSCRDQVDAMQEQQNRFMGVAEYKDNIIQCMEARGYVYQD